MMRKPARATRLLMAAALLLMLLASAADAAGGRDVLVASNAMDRRGRAPSFVDEPDVNGGLLGASECERAPCA